MSAAGAIRQASLTAIDGCRIGSSIDHRSVRLGPRAEDQRQIAGEPFAHRLQLRSRSRRTLVGGHATPSGRQSRNIMWIGARSGAVRLSYQIPVSTITACRSIIGTSSALSPKPTL